MSTGILVHNSSIKLRRSRLRPLSICRMFMTAEDQFASLVQASMPVVIHNQQRVVTLPLAELRQLGQQSLQRISHGNQPVVYCIPKGFEGESQSLCLVLKGDKLAVRANVLV